MTSPLPLSLVLETGFSEDLATDSSMSWRDQHDFQPVRRLGGDERARLLTTSGLKHGRYHAFSSALALAGCRRCLSATRDGGARTGVIAVGGPLHCGVAWEFAEKLVGRGPEFLNPLFFPHTIVSSVPCAVASALGAKAFAFAAGYDHHAYFEVLRSAAQTIRLGFCDQVLTVACFDANGVVQRAAQKAMPSSTLGDTAVSGLLTVAARQPAVLLLDSQLEARDLAGLVLSAEAKASIPAANNFCVTVRDGVVKDGTFRSALEESQVFTATGGVLIIEAARAMWLREGSARCEPFLVACEADGRASGVVLQWNDC